VPYVLTESELSTFEYRKRQEAAKTDGKRGRRRELREEEDPLANVGYVVSR
jgi:hypothetical protein